MEHIVLKSKDNISYDVDMAQVKYLRMINELVRDFEGVVSQLNKSCFRRFNKH